MRWEVRILSWPDLRPLAAEAFTGGDPDSVIGGQHGGSSVGSLPIAEFSEWLSAEATGPARPPDQREFSKLVFLGDSGKIALLACEDMVTIWDPAAGKDVKTLESGSATIKKVAFASRSGAAITLEEQGKFPDLTPVTRTWSLALIDQSGRVSIVGIE